MRHRGETKGMRKHAWNPGNVEQPLHFMRRAGTSTGSASRARLQGRRLGSSRLFHSPFILCRLVEDEAVLQKILDRYCLVAAVVSCFICCLPETALISLVRFGRVQLFSTSGLHLPSSALILCCPRRVRQAEEF